MRELNERCNYDEMELRFALDKIKILTTIDARAVNTNKDNRWGMVSLSSVNIIEQLSVSDMYTLQVLILKTLQYRSFELITVHDEFKCHPNHVHMMRTKYLEIMIELADSELFQSVLREITGLEDEVYNKISNDLSSKMTNAEYHIC